MGGFPYQGPKPSCNKISGPGRIPRSWGHPAHTAAGGFYIELLESIQAEP